MSQTKHQLNDRKRRLGILKRRMAKDGYEFKKAVKNVITFRNPDTGEKIRLDLTQETI